MQQIERYGVIALVFLLVTIVAVSFWGDNKSPGFWSRLTGKAKKDEVAKTETPPPLPAATAEEALNTPIPLNETPGQPMVAPPVLAHGGAQVPPPGTSPFPVLDAAQSPAGAPPHGMQPPGGMPLSGAGGGSVPLAQPPVHVSTPGAGTLEYTVQKGDSLALISRRTLGSEQRWTEIQALNPGVTPKSLKVGAKLKLPDGAHVAASTRTTPKSPAKLATQTPPKQAAPTRTANVRYTIQRGDTLNAIAERKLGSKGRVQEILALNPGLDPRKLSVGKTIQLPGSGAPATPARADRTPLVAQASARPSNSDRPRVR